MAAKLLSSRAVKSDPCPKGKTMMEATCEMLDLILAGVLRASRCSGAHKIHGKHGAIDGKTQFVRVVHPRYCPGPESRSILHRTPIHRPLPPYCTRTRRSRLCRSHHRTPVGRWKVSFAKRNTSSASYPFGSCVSRGAYTPVNVSSGILAKCKSASCSWNSKNKNKQTLQRCYTVDHPRRTWKLKRQRISDRNTKASAAGRAQRKLGRLEYTSAEPKALSERVKRSRSHKRVNTTT